MKKYQSHKVVEAGKIVSIGEIREGFDITLNLEMGAIEVSRGWYIKHEPTEGGYYIRYEDGHTSFSPAEAFEAGYVEIIEEVSSTPIYRATFASKGQTGPVRDFGTALEMLKNGKTVTRERWNGKGQFLTLQIPTETSKMTLPYIFITTVDGDLVPWVCSQTDMLAEDWYIC